jgi:lysophospholipase L1-like esterase
MRPHRAVAWLLFTLSTSALATPALAADSFYLKDGDRVVFYGDSITEQRLYTTFVETYVVTRFPKLNVSFVHSGWGGDRVTGGGDVNRGGGGPIDLRLKRDVFAYKPTVVTVMLGMNDASYKAFDAKVFDAYSRGYEHIVDMVKTFDPDIRMTLIQPSPYDDVTRPPTFEGGYNAVLVRYGEFVKDLARRNHLDYADMNTPLVEATKKAFESDPESAKKFNPDRVHPAPYGQVIMAAALLKAWGAPAIVSKVSIRIDGEKSKADPRKTELIDLVASRTAASWTQKDETLPFPIALTDPLFELAARSSDLVQSLDRQMLEVSGLAPGNYLLKIDGQEFGPFSTVQLDQGINLATLQTPMVKQAFSVHDLTLRHNTYHAIRWRQVQIPLASVDEAKLAKALADLDAIEDDVVKQQRERAQPKPHKFELMKKD